jgi:hypothetical protein
MGLSMSLPLGERPFLSEGDNGYRPPLVTQEEAYRLSQLNKVDKGVVSGVVVKPKHKRGSRNSKKLEDHRAGVTAYRKLGHRLFTDHMTKKIYEHHKSFSHWRHRITKREVPELFHLFHRSVLSKISILSRGKMIVRRRFRNRMAESYSMDNYWDWYCDYKDKQFSVADDDNGQALYESIQNAEDYRLNPKIFWHPGQY